MENQNKPYNPANDSIKQLWTYDKRLDRYLVILQTVFTLTFSYRAHIWGLFVFIAFVCFFLVPLIYFSKFAKGWFLNKKLYELVREQKIPAWIPRRRIRTWVIWLIIGNPVTWMFFAATVATASQALPIFVSLILAIPWYLLERLHKKEEPYLAPYIK
ncbi:MAG: hypothetical protein WCS88_04735 [Patescibacteria group bacterium]